MLFCILFCVTIPRLGERRSSLYSHQGGYLLGLYKIILYLWLMVGDLVFLVHVMYVLVNPSERGSLGEELLEMVTRIIFGPAILIKSILFVRKLRKEAEKAGLEGKPESEEAVEKGSPEEKDASEEEEAPEEEKVPEEETAEEEDAA